MAASSVHQVVGVSLLAIFFTHSLAGCGTAFKGSGPYDPSVINSDPPPGQRYYVGKHLIIVTADITKTVIPEVLDNLQVRPIIRVAATATINTRLVPDYRQYYMLELDTGPAYDSTITVTSSSDGLLKTFSADATGKVGDSIRNIGTIAANVAALGLTPFSADKELTAAQNNCIETARSLTLDNAHQFFVKTDLNGCVLLQDRVSKEDTLKRLGDSISFLRNSIAGKSDFEEIRNLGDQLNSKVVLRATVADELQVVNTRYDALFKIFEDKTLARKEVKSKLTKVFEVDELPEDSSIHSKIGETEDDMVRYLQRNEKTKKMAELMSHAKLVITKKSFVPAGSKYFSNDKTDFPKQKTMSTKRIFFRQSYPFLIGEYVLKNPGGDPTKAELYHKSNSIHSLMHPHSSIQFVEFDASTFARRNLELTFEDDTRALITTKTENGSALAASTKSVSDTIVGIQTDYASALGRIEQAQNALRRIELNDYTKQIEELKKRKELVDAQVDFEGAQANQELLLEKKILDQKLSTLKSELAYKTLEATYEQDLALSEVNAELKLLNERLNHATKEITYEQKLELEKLKSEILVLQERMKHIEAEQ